MTPLKISRPKIGIALGSGVARGWAHIGVLRELDEAGIEADIVSGTSIGALVGACHVAGKLDALEEFARSLNKRRILGLLDFRFRSTGIIGDAKLADLMQAHLSGLAIEDLPKTFVAVATELTTGHELWLHHGDLIQSIRASYAVPGIFTPMAVDGRWLIDGALVNPVPVSVARALGSRVVIAVNLTNDPYDTRDLRRARREVGNANSYVKDLAPPPLRDDHIFEGLEEAIDNDPSVRDEIAARREEQDKARAVGTDLPMHEWLWDSVFGTSKRKEETEVLQRVVGGGKQREPRLASVLLASLNIVTDRLGRMRMASDPPDVVIAPKVGHMSLLDFDRADEMIRLGREATRQALPDIIEAIELMA